MPLTLVVIMRSECNLGAMNQKASRPAPQANLKASVLIKTAPAAPEAKSNAMKET
jgi:hypothetical protein